MFNILFVLLLVFSFFVLIGIGRSGRVVSTSLTNSCLNPFYFISAILVFFVLDFSFLYLSDLNFAIYEEFLVVDHEDVIYAFFYVALCFLFFLIGLRFGLGSGKVGVDIGPFSRAFDPKVNGLVFFVISGFIIIQFLFGSNLLSAQVSGDLSRQVILSDNKLLYIAFGMLVPAYAFYVTSLSQNKQSMVFPTLLALIICFVSGSRGWVLYVLLVFAYANREYLKKYGLSVYLFVAPLVIVFLVVTRFLFRESWRYSSFQDFLNDSGGVFALFFNTSEVSMAEVISLLIKYSDYLPRQFYEPILAALMYPFPRDILGFKPMGTDAYVTSVFSPERWFWSKSEITVTFFGDLFLHFEFIASLFVILLIAYFFGRLIRFGLAHSSFSPVMIAIPLWVFYVLARSSFFNAASPVWAFLFVFVLNYLGCVLFLSRKELSKR